VVILILLAVVDDQIAAIAIIVRAVPSAERRLSQRAVIRVPLLPPRDNACRPLKPGCLASISSSGRPMKPVLPVTATSIGRLDEVWPASYPPGLRRGGM
jgi:hypothetical protein